MKFAKLFLIVLWTVGVVNSFTMNCTKIDNMLKGVFSGCQITWEKGENTDNDTTNELYISNNGIAVRSNVTINYK